MSEIPHFDKVVVCPPWNAQNAAEPGVRSVGCEVCGSSLVISPVSVKLMRSDGAVALCVRCMEEGVQAHGEPNMLMPPGQREEISRRFGVPLEEVDRLLEFVRDLGPEEVARKIREFHEREQNS